jgi:hypothetical protein
MKIQNGALPPALPAGPEIVIRLYYVTHPRVPKPLLGPFLSPSDAECGLVVMRSEGASVSSKSVDALDQLTRWQAINNGEIVRLFVEGIRHG